MTTLRLLPLGFLAALLPLVACDEGGMRGLGSDDRDDAPRAEYAREMIFVADDGTAAAVLDFATVDAGSILRRSARAWAESGSGWAPLYDLSWEGEPVRRAWRLVPHGPIRLRVGLDDEIESLMIRDGDVSIAALETGDFVTEWTPSRSAQLVLREATFALGGEPMPGWLIDARFGVTPQALDEDAAAVAGPNGVRPPGSATPGAGVYDTASDTGAAAIADTAGAITEPVPASLRVLSVRGALFGADGTTLVLADTEAGLGGWLWTVERELVLPAITLTETSDARAWTVEAAGGETALSGRLQVLDEEPTPVSPLMVGGTVRIDGSAFELRGVLRPES